MKRTLGLLLLFLCAAALLPTSARADAGGWPTATPTVTPTSTTAVITLPTLTPVTAATITPTTPPDDPYPAVNSGSMITPPALAPLPDESGKALPVQSASGSAQGSAQSASQSSGSLLGGGVACWPLAIIALLVGIAILNWMRSGIRRGT